MNAFTKEKTAAKEKTTAKTAIIIGATGLVGQHLVAKLSAQYAQVVAIVRRVPSTTAQSVHYEQLGDFANLGNFVGELAETYDLQGADAFSTLGTTQKQAGSKDAFYAVDYGFNLAFAQAVLQAGCLRFFLLSSLGASANSRTSFYLRTKGKLEDAIGALGFEQVAIFQPSLLLGEHEGRVLENVGQSLFKLVKPIVPETLAHRPIEAERVAQAMTLTAQQPSPLTGLQNGRATISNAAMLKMTLSPA